MFAPLVSSSDAPAVAALRRPGGRDNLPGPRRDARRHFMEIRLTRAAWSFIRIAAACTLMTMAGAGGSAAAAQEPVGPPPAPADTVDPTSGVSAAGAFARSLVLPGWGQAYVGAPGRGAVYFLMEAGSAWMAYKSWRQLQEARELQEWLRSPRFLAARKQGATVPGFGTDGELDLVESREQQLEDWLAISIFLLLFSGADAYVTAQLADFEEHVGVRPGRDGGARLELRVPVGAVRR